MVTATKKQAKENLKKYRQEESDRIRRNKIENPHRDRVLSYFSQWNNEANAANNLELPMSLISSTLRELEREGLVTSRDREMEWKANQEPWLTDVWFVEEEQASEGFWFKVDLGRKIKFKIWENKEYFGEYTRADIWEFEISKRSLISQIKKHNILPTEYIAAYANTNLTPQLSTCIPCGDRYFFVDEKLKILQFEKKEIESFLKIDSEIKVQEFFLAKANQKELKRGDRVLITYYQLGIFETLRNEWEFLRFKKPYHCEINRGDAIGENFKKLPLWRIQKCSNTANSSEELAVSPSPSETISAIASPPPDTVTSTSQRSPSTPLTSPMSPSTETSEPTSQPEENLTSSLSLSPAPVPATQATAKGSHTQNQHSGEKDLESCAKSDLNMQSGNNLWELPIADYEQSLEDAEWLTIKQNLESSRREAAARHITAKEFLQLPTLTANEGKKSRTAGSSKLEQRFKELGLTPNGSKLNPPAMAMLMGYPANWCEAIIPSKPSIPPASPEAKDEIKPASCSVKQSHRLKQGLHLPESSTLHRAHDNKLSTEQQPTIAIGDLVVISNLHKVSAGKIFEVGEVRSGNYITTKEGFCFSPTRYEPFDPVRSLLKIDSQHPTLGDRIVEAESYKNGYIKIVGGGCVALEMVIAHQSPVTSHELAATILDELQITQTILNHGNAPYWNDIECVALGLDEEVQKHDPPHEHPAFKVAIALLDRDGKIERRGNEIRLSVNSKQSPVTEQPIPAKAISLWQPWASLIAMGKKHYETRSWATDYRGKLLICSTKKKPSKAELEYFGLTLENAPLGVTIAIADLTDCILMDREFIDRQSADEWDVGDWQLGRYAWKLENIIAIDPQPIRGYQGLWNIDDLSLYLPDKLPTEPPKKKRGRRKGSANKKAASGSLSVRKDVKSGAGIYSYWDIETQKIKKLSVPSTLFARVEKAIADGKSVPDIIGIIKGMDAQLTLKF